MTIDPFLTKLLTEAIIVRDEPFNLKGGGQSRVYLDARPVVLGNPSTVGEGMADLIRSELLPLGSKLPHIGGCPLLGPVLACLVAERLHTQAFAVRSETKDHGTGKLIEGPPFYMGRVILVDDVFTTGSTLSQAMDVLAEQEIEAEAIFVLVNRHPDAEPGRPFVWRNTLVYAIHTLSELVPEGIS